MLRETLTNHQRLGGIYDHTHGYEKKVYNFFEFVHHAFGAIIEYYDFIVKM